MFLDLHVRRHIIWFSERLRQLKESSHRVRSDVSQRRGDAYLNDTTDDDTSVACKCTWYDKLSIPQHSISLLQLHVHVQLFSFSTDYNAFILRLWQSVSVVVLWRHQSRWTGVAATLTTVSVSWCQRCVDSAPSWRPRRVTGSRHLLPTHAPPPQAYSSDHSRRRRRVTAPSFARVRV